MGTVDSGVGIFLSPLNTEDGFYLYHMSESFSINSEFKILRLTFHGQSVLKY